MRRLWLGVAVLVLGLWIWLSSLGVPYISFSKNWPLILVAIGVIVVVRRIRRMRRSHRRKVHVIINKLEEGRIDAEEAISEIKGGKHD